MLLIVLSLTSCRQARLKRTRVAPEPVKVEVLSVDFRDVGMSNYYVGSLEYGRRSSLKSPHNGTLDQVYVKEGQSVKAGQPLLYVHSQTVMSTNAAAAAKLAQARDAHRRASEVYNQGGLSELKMMEINTQLEQAEASAKAAESALEECTLKAPYDCCVDKLEQRCGERVSLLDDLVSIVDPTSKRVEFQVPETEINAIEIGTKVTVSFLGSDEQVRGTVTSKSLTAHSLSHSYRCIVQVAKLPADAVAGMVCRVILTKDDNSSIVIPADAVKLDSEGKYVWTVDAENVVHKTSIQTGAFAEKGVSVIQGLSSGDKVIVAGTSKVSTGMKVKLQ